MLVVKIVLLVILGIVFLALLIKAFGGGGSAEAAAGTPAARSSVPPVIGPSTGGIRDARPGSILEIAGAGDDGEDLSLRVDRRDRYRAGGEEWYELGGTCQGKRRFVEWFEDGGKIEVLLDTGRRPSMEDVGLTEEILARMDDEQSEKNVVRYEGREWRYVGSEEVTFFERGGDEGEGFYSWEFYGDDGRGSLWVEKWEDEPFEVGISLRIAPERVTVRQS